MHSNDELFAFVRVLFSRRDKVSMAKSATNALIKYLPSELPISLVRAYFPAVRDNGRLVEPPLFRVIHGAANAGGNTTIDYMIDAVESIFSVENTNVKVIEYDNSLWIGSFYENACVCALQLMFSDNKPSLDAQTINFCSHISKFLGYALENLISLKIVTFRVQRVAKNREKHETQKRALEEKHIVDLMLLTKRISEKLNNPLTVASHAFRNLDMRFNKLFLDYETNKSSDLFLRLQSVWMSYHSILEKSFSSLERLSRELIDIKEESKGESRLLLKDINQLDIPMPFDIKNGGKLHVIQGSFASTLEPALIKELQGNVVARNIFETLVRLHPEYLEVEPGLAECWTVCRDYRKYLFQLRKGVVFQDGTEFNADAVIFSLGRQLFDTHDAYDTYGGWSSIHTSGLKNLIENISKIDNYSVEIHLKHPDSSFLASLSMNCTAIVSPTAAIKHGSNFAWNPVGTGPFVFVEAVQGQKIILQRFDEYWDHKAHVDSIEFSVFSDSEKLINIIKPKRAAVILTPELVKVSQDIIREWPKVKTIQSGAFLMCYIAFNTKKFPFNNRNTRRAVAMAFNKKMAIAEAFPANTISAKTLLPPTLWGNHDEIPDYPYSPDEAHRLLIEAGLADGFEFSMDVTAESIFHNNFAQTLQSGLKHIGITMHINKVPWQELLSRVESAEHDAAIVSWRSDNGDPDNFLYVLLHGKNAHTGGTNLAQYDNPEVNWLLDEAKRVPWVEERVILYHRVQEIAHEDLPWLPICHVMEHWACDDYVQDLHPHPLQHGSFNKVWIDYPPLLQETLAINIDGII